MMIMDGSASGAASKLMLREGGMYGKGIRYIVIEALRGAGIFSLAVMCLSLCCISCASQQLRNPMELDALSGSTAEVKVGQTMVVHFHSFSSAGLGASWTVSDENIVSFVRTDIAYKNAQDDSIERCGGDEATGAYVFCAKNPGKTRITVNALARGQVEKTSVVDLIVLP
jgi:hypothetical protein